MEPSALASADVLDFENRPSRRLIILGKLCSNCLFDMYAKKYKLTTNAWEILALVGRYEPIFPHKVGELTTMESDRVSRAVEALVGRGLVVRNNDIADRRRVILGLTAKGHKVYEEIDAVRRTLDADMLDILSETEQAELGRLLGKLETYSRAAYTGKDAWKKILAKRGTAERPG
ncbi:MAG TPA: winged helix DNA-binding protein [Burkholderiaceae bacterium]|nr:winged helix DNA-binding protein [Burkholderiaceae bacterium]